MLVTFLDNHDTPRLAAVPGVTPARLRVAAAFLLTTRGIQQLTWGDEIGLPGHMDDRREFPGGFPGDPTTPSPPPDVPPPSRPSIRRTASSCGSAKQRRSSPRGTLTDLIAGETLYVYEGEYQGEGVVVGLNLGKSAATVALPIRAGVSGLPERLFGEVRWVAKPDGHRLEIPSESAAVVRVVGRH